MLCLVTAEKEWKEQTYCKTTQHQHKILWHLSVKIKETNKINSKDISNEVYNRLCWYVVNGNDISNDNDQKLM